MSEHKNWYWEIEDFGNALVGRLHFKEFHADKIILEWQLNKNCDNEFNYTSSFLNVEQNVLIAKNPDAAMEVFIDKIEDHIEEQICLLEDQLKKFKELKS